MAITNMDGVSAGLAGNSPRNIFKAAVTTQIAGIGTAYSRSVGLPAQMAIPTTAATCTNALVGAINLPTPGGGETLYLARWFVSSSLAGVFNLSHRLAHMGGLSGVSGGSANVNLVTANSNGWCNADGSDVLWFLQWYINTGGTAVTATVTYVNQSDTTLTTTIALPATTRLGRLYQILPTVANGGYIKSVTSVSLSVSTGTAGNFGVTAYKFVASGHTSLANNGQLQDFAGAGLPIIHPTGFYEIISFPNSTTTAGLINSQVTVISQ